MGGTPEGQDVSDTGQLLDALTAAVCGLPDAVKGALDGADGWRAELILAAQSVAGAAGPVVERMGVDSIRRDYLRLALEPGRN